MKKIAICLSVLALASTACTDFLTEEPKLSQSKELTLSKFSGLDDAAAGTYLYLQSNAWFGCQYVLNNELMAGNATNPVSLPGSGRYREAEPWSFTESSTWSTWTYAYLTIAAANNVINNLEGKTSNEVSQKDIDNVMAEALFMRAFCHFQLVNIYAQPYLNGANKDMLGVPYMKEAVISQPARNTIGEVYDAIVADLTNAESLMSDDYQRSGVVDALATVTKPAIQALLSRVYLYMGKWQECADYATKVINSDKFSLYDAEAYLDMWSLNTAAAGGEIIFEVYSSKKNDSWDDSGWTMLPYVTSINGSADVCATEDLFNMYEPGDVRSQLFDVNVNDHFMTKYIGKTGSVDPKESNIPVLRLAEMYLNRAEALARGAQIQGATAQKDLDAITTARGASSVTEASTSAIFDERRKELAFEGHIWFDYKRLGKSITRTDFRATQNQNINFPGNIWAMPIPKAELDANPNMEQNPY